MQGPSSSTVKITYFDEAAVWQALRDFVSSLVECHPEVQKIVLFGSLARGDCVPGSDVDLLLVIATSDAPFPRRIADYTPASFPVGVDLFPYTGEELTKMMTEGNSFLQRALREGIVIFERPI